MGGSGVSCEGVGVGGETGALSLGCDTELAGVKAVALTPKPNNSNSSNNNNNNNNNKREPPRCKMKQTSKTKRTTRVCNLTSPSRASKPAKRGRHGNLNTRVVIWTRGSRGRELHGECRAQVWRVRVAGGGARRWWWCAFPLFGGRDRRFGGSGGSRGGAHVTTAK